MELSEIATKLCDMPPSIRAFVHQSETGEYTIFVNARLNEIQRMKAYKHELRHIFGNDFEKYSDVDSLESSNHKIS